MNETPALEGLWQPVYAELGGEEAPLMALQKMELEMTAGHYTVRFGGEVSDHGTYSVDPHGLTLHGIAGPNEGRTIPSLFKFAGTALSICYGLDGKRPSSFTGRSDQPWYLVNYRRKDPFEIDGEDQE